MTEDTPDNLNISRVKLQKVADFLPYPFIIAEVIDGEHLNTHLNEKFLEEIGYSLAEIPTIEAWYENAYPDVTYREKVIRDWDQEEIESQRKGKVFVKMKSHVTCKNGTKRWYEVKASVVNTVHVVAFVDLDKETQLQEELKNINYNNDRMLSILGHDLRSPVAILLSMSTMAANTDISKEEYTELIEIVNKKSKNVLEMLDNTLNWARLNFDNIKVTPVEIDFEEIVNSIVTIYQSKNITMDVKISNSRIIESDVEVLTIIIRNLISNAIKFTGKNGLITIATTTDGLVIKDNGMGMPQHLIDDIMSNRQSTRKGTDEELGTGLGLQLVMALAEKINCKITIKSVEAEGTSVYLSF